MTGVGFAIGVTGAGLELEVAKMAAGAAPTGEAVPTELSPAAT